MFYFIIIAINFDELLLCLPSYFLCGPTYKCNCRRERDQRISVHLVFFYFLGNLHFFRYYPTSHFLYHLFGCCIHWLVTCLFFFIFATLYIFFPCYMLVTLYWMVPKHIFVKQLTIWKMKFTICLKSRQSHI